MNSFWITNCGVVTQNQKREVFWGSVYIHQGRIAKFKRGDSRKLSPRAPVMDAQGCYLFPGFVQTHLHLCQTLFRNLADDLELLDWLKRKIWVFESKHSWDSLFTSALLGIHELLSSGTTTILDMGTVRHTDAIFTAVLKTGIRANVGKCLMDHPKFNPKGLRENTADALGEAQELYGLWNGRENDRIRASFAPRFALSCTESLMRAVGEISRETGALIHTHACENPTEIKLVKKTTGLENIAYFEKVGLTSPRLVCAHGVWLSDREVATLARSGSTITHCPSSNLKLASGIADIPRLLRARVRVALGADGAPCNNHLDALNEMRLAGLIQKPKHGPKAMPAPLLLDLATREGAKALHWFEDIGSIELGKKADLTLIDLNGPHALIPDGKESDLESIASTLIYSASAADVKATWVDGKIVWDGKRVRGISQPKLINEARKHQLRILRK